MTEKDKEDFKSLIRETLHECGGGCPLGINPKTAHELISFADTWKTCRRYMIGGIITVAVGGILAALWMGFKQMVKG